MKLDAADFDRLVKQGRVPGMAASAKKPKKVATRSMHEVALERQLREAGDAVPAWECEVELIPGRRFRCDFLFREPRVALEVHGLIHSGQGGHQNSAGFAKDCHKAFRLAILGWLPVAVTPAMIASGEAIELLIRLFAARADATMTRAN